MTYAELSTSMLPNTLESQMVSKNVFPFSQRLGFRYILKYMINSRSFFNTLAVGVLLCSCGFSSQLIAHQVTNANGKASHQHVYKSNAYGTGATAGHFAQPAGSKGIVIWQAAPKRGYGKSQPGFKVPQGQATQRSQLKMYQQKQVFTKTQNRTPTFPKK